MIRKIAKGISVLGFYYIYSYLFYFLFILLKINVAEYKDIPKSLTFLIIDVILVAILFYIYQKDLKKEFKIFKDNFLKFIEKNVKYWIIGLLLMVVSNYIINYFTQGDISNNEKVVRNMIDILPFYSIVSVAIIAPFTEEIIFRKTFKDMTNNKYVFIILSGLAFGLVHIISTYKTPIDMLYIIPYGMFGSVFAYMYYKTNTIFSPMFMHFVHNTLLLMIYFISNIIR